MKSMLICFLLSINFFLFSCSSTSEQERAEKKADLYYQHGTAKLIQKDYTGALDALLKASRYRKNDSKIHNNLGMAFYFKGEINKALAHIKKAIKVGPKNSDARNNLASIYFKRKQFDLAEREYMTVKKHLTYPHQYRTNYNLALIYLKKDLTSKAIKSLNLAIKDKKDYCAAHFKLGEISKDKYQYKQAYLHFKNASRGTCVSLPAPLYQQAMLLIKMRKWDEARDKLHILMENTSSAMYSSLAMLRLKEIDIAENTASRSNSINRRPKKKPRGDTNSTLLFNSQSF